MELHIRDIKTAMNLDVLRCKTPAMVRQELWTGLLVYNLIRQSILQSAHEAECQPDELSFTATMQMLANSWLVAAVIVDGSCDASEPLVRFRLIHGGSHRVGNRPDRVEPRAAKRRPKSHPLLTTPRRQARPRWSPAARRNLNRRKRQCHSLLTPFPPALSGPPCDHAPGLRQPTVLSTGKASGTQILALVIFQ